MQVLIADLARHAYWPPADTKFELHLLSCAATFTATPASCASWLVFPLHPHGHLSLFHLADLLNAVMCQIHLLHCASEHCRVRLHLVRTIDVNSALHCVDPLELPDFNCISVTSTSLSTSVLHGNWLRAACRPCVRIGPLVGWSAQLVGPARLPVSDVIAPSYIFTI